MRSGSDSIIYSGGGVREQEEPLIRKSIVAEKILQRKSLQLRNKQQDWQVLIASEELENQK